MSCVCAWISNRQREWLDFVREKSGNEQLVRKSNKDKSNFLTVFVVDTKLSLNVPSNKLL